METLVVGDLHGQVEIVFKVLKLDMPTIFIGDYLDSFNRSVHDQVNTIMAVRDAIESGQAVGLLGNHELSYFVPGMRASGWHYATESHMMHFDYSMFKDYTYAEGFFISHAGISQRLLDSNGITADEYIEAAQFNEIGRYRGGRHTCGGLFWCDWNKEFEPVEGLPQIVGHTRGDLIRAKGNSYCIDCLEDTKPQVLAIKDGQARVVTL